MLPVFLTLFALNSFVSCDSHSLLTKWEERLNLENNVKHFQQDETVFCDSKEIPETATQITSALKFFISTKEHAEKAKDKLLDFENQIKNIEAAEKALDNGVDEEILLLKAFVENTKDLQTEIANVEQEKNLRKLLKYGTDHLAIRDHWDLQKKRVDEFYNLIEKYWDIMADAVTEFSLVATLLKTWNDVVAGTINDLGFPTKVDFDEAKKKGCGDDSYLKEGLQIHKMLETVDRNSLPTIEKVLKDKTAKLQGYIRQSCSCTYNLVKRTAQLASKISAMNNKLRIRISTCGEANARRDNLRKDYWKVAQIVEARIMALSKKKETENAAKDEL